MSDFADVERFAREHGTCGGLTPSAIPRPGGGYLLTIRCACGASLDRWVSPEVARRPLPIPTRVDPGPPPSPPPVAPAGAPSGSAPARPAPSEPGPEPGADLDAVAREALAAGSPAPEPAAPPGRPRPAPGRPAPDTLFRPPVQSPAPTPPRPPRASRGRAVWLALFLIVGLGAAGLIYVAGGPGALHPLAPDGAGAPGHRDPQRATLEGVVRSLRELHAVATSTTSASVYSARVTAARAEVERFLATSPPGPSRTRVREALDIHLLAASAWRARSLDQREAWEAVGLDPTIDLCQPLRLVADFAAQSEEVSRAQTRGAAVASALPLLWECANERLAVLEQALAGR